MKRRIIAAVASLGLVVGFTACIPDIGNTGPPPEEQPCSTPHSGDLEVTVANTTIDGYCVNGGKIIIDENADNVTVTNSVIEGDDWSGGFFIEPGATGLVVDHTEIDCNGVLGSSGIGGSNYTLQYSEVRGCENGAHISGNVHLNQNLFHDFIPYNPIDDPHIDGIQFDEGASDVVIEWNKIEAPNASSALSFWDAAGNQNEDVIVRFNGFIGGAYVVRFGVSASTGVEFYGNRLGNLTSEEFGLCTSNSTDAVAVDVWGREKTPNSDTIPPFSTVLDQDNVNHITNEILDREDC